MKRKFDLEDIKRLKELCAKSTPVNGWYPHHKEVRGPWNRWFTCSEIPDKTKNNVAETWDDCEFAAAAMNNFLPLLELVEQLMIDQTLLVDDE